MPSKKKTEYVERPYQDAVADPEAIAAAEARPAVDQIPDYHEKNPTLSRTKKAQKELDEKIEEQHEGEPGE